MTSEGDGVTDRASCPVVRVVEMNRDPSPWTTLRDDAAGEARSTVVRSEEYGGFHLLLGYDEVKAAALDVATYTSKHGATIPPLSAGVPALPTETDPPDHLAYRRLLVSPLRPDRVEQLVPAVRTHVRELIQALRAEETPDLIAGLARKVPPAIIAKVIGLPDDDVDHFVELAHALDMAAAAQDPEANKRAAIAMLGYIDEVIVKAQRDPSDSLASTIANAEIDGHPIGRDGAVGVMLTLILAGHHTTINGIGSTLHLIATVPGLREKLLADPSLIPTAVEEAMRVESPIFMMGRTTTCPVVVGGVELPAGAKVGLGWGAANHDESHFPDPEAFSLERGRPAHVAFGHGVHKCVGEHLARMEIRVVVEEVLREIPKYRVVGPVEFGGQGLPSQNRGLASLPVDLTAHH